MEFVVIGEAATIALARVLGEGAGSGAVFALHGALGAGKTRFAQGLALAFGVREPVCSPTFTLVNEHEGREGALFLHMDLYRLADEDAVADFGFEELVEHAALTAIEWPERSGALLPEGAVHVWIKEEPAEDARRIRVDAPGRLRLEETLAARIAGIAGVRKL